MKTIKIFLASSSELKGDREQFEIFISRQNTTYVEKGVFLKLELWEDFLDALSKTRLQDEYNRTIAEGDLFVSLFHTKAGQFTVEEFDTAWQTFLDKGKPRVYTYFKDEPPASMSDIRRADFLSLDNFKKRLEALGHFPTKYETVADLLHKFGEQLTKVVDGTC